MLTFASGRISGTGHDPAGSFAISGGYDTKSGDAWLVKSYDTWKVNYAGRAAEGDAIRGTWTINGAGGIALDGGAFEIWPDSSAIEEAQSVWREEPAPSR